MAPRANTLAPHWPALGLVFFSASAIGWSGGVLAAPATRWGKCPAAVRELADRADRITRGESSEGLMSMKVFKRGTVSLRLRYWSKGRDKFLAKIDRPSRLRGMATLKSGESLWSYLPRMDRIVKLGSSMMGSSWMGSHFTNDDLVKESDVRKHYRCEGTRREGASLVITTFPLPNAPVVWGKVETKIVEKTAIPVWVKFYDERGVLKRTMSYHEVRTVSGRLMPTKMVLQPASSPSERTVVTFEQTRFNQPIADDRFSLRGLKR